MIAVITGGTYSSRLAWNINSGAPTYVRNMNIHTSTHDGPGYIYIVRTLRAALFPLRHSEFYETVLLHERTFSPNTKLTYLRRRSLKRCSAQNANT